MWCFCLRDNWLFYKRSVAVVAVTELNMKVLSSGTYCLVISLMTSWAAQPPAIETAIEERKNRETNVMTLNKAKRYASSCCHASRLYAWMRDRVVLARTCNWMSIPFDVLTDERSNGMQFSRTVATHFMKVVVLRDTAALTTQVVQKSREASLSSRDNNIVINFGRWARWTKPSHSDGHLDKRRDVREKFVWRYYYLQFGYIRLDVVVIVTGVRTVFCMELVDGTQE